MMQLEGHMFHEVYLRVIQTNNTDFLSWGIGYVGIQYQDHFAYAKS